MGLEHTAVSCRSTLCHTAPPLVDWRSFDDGVTVVLYDCSPQKASSDGVSGDVSFRRPAVESLVVTMHGWALPCDPKSGFRTPSSTSYWLNFYHDVFGASANLISPFHSNSSIFRGVMAFFLISPKLQIPLTSCFFSFFRSYGRGLVGVHQ